MIHGVPGFRAAGISCGCKASGALDLALIASDRPAAAAGLFTQNQVPGAPVRVSKEHLHGGKASAIVVNSGVANVATGARGLRNTRRMCDRVAAELGLRASQVQVASTGVIGPQLPIAKIDQGIRIAADALSPRGFSKAARAILTTDNKPKLAGFQSRKFSLLGMAKGAGMIQPRMATMLCYLVTDVAATPAFLRSALCEAVEPTLNAVTIDGETSTSDTVLLLANGVAGNRPLTSRSPGAVGFRKALRALCEELTVKLAEDGEGVTKLCDVRVRGASSDAAAEKVARSVANSALVKTALFGSDPNWGRVVQAVGAAGVRLRPDRLGIRFSGVPLLRRGRPLESKAALRDAQRAMRRKRVSIEIDLGSGRGTAHLLTTDLSYEYVRINAEYTT